ncbi:TlpA family protein disulfide reductase [Psychroflexus aestuariivivens]|uniref:TlpA family protein disulfide reductase n=1 Tax=Psychroflexus aestuariivivens TaxID=1795040 RepID=UPI000FDC92FE|nr:redoxin domain-containing protein [Psychroflexus aestuariivivens]
MMKNYILIVFVLHSFIFHSQSDSETERKTYFSEMIATYQPRYQKKAKIARNLGNRQLTEELLDTLINQKLIGSYMDNFNVDCLASRNCCLNDYKKPIYLITYASWCIPSKGEIPAINDFIKNHHKNIDFVLLLWDEKREVIKFSRQFHRKMDVVYVNELKNRDAYTVRMLKHSLGFPTTFLIGSDKKILEIRKNTQIHPSTDAKKALEICVSEIKNDIQIIMNYESKIKQEDVEE